MTFLGNGENTAEQAVGGGTGGPVQPQFSIHRFPGSWLDGTICRCGLAGIGLQQRRGRIAARQKNPRMLGYLCTTWGKVKIADAADWPPLKEVLAEWK